MTLTDNDLKTIADKIITWEDVSVCAFAYLRHSTDQASFKEFVEYCINCYKEKRR